MNVAVFGRKIDARSMPTLLAFLKKILARTRGVYIYKEFSDTLGGYGDSSLQDILHGMKTYSSLEDFPDGVDLMMSLGGDGTFLDAVCFLQGKQIPIAGVNFGRLGFLTTLSSDSLSDGNIDILLSGKFRTEKRALLKLKCDAMPAEIYPYALNEISIQRLGASMLNVELTMDGMELPAYWSDGFLISTPTGSTAYSLSAGGPVVLPTAKALIVTPVAPHNLNVRPMIVPSSTHFRLIPSSRGGKSFITLDNRSFEVMSGTVIEIGIAEYTIECVSLQNNSFIRALKEKLMWGEDRRNSSY